jgi:hypothetical protein
MSPSHSAPSSDAALLLVDVFNEFSFPEAPAAARRRDVVQLLVPETRDYFVFKPEHSGLESGSSAGYPKTKRLIRTVLRTTQVCVLHRRGGEERRLGGTENGGSVN